MASWQEQFFEKLVSAAQDAGDERLATARLHRRKKTASFTHSQFLGNSGHANNPTLWLVAQAVSESLSDGDKEKQLMQGLLNQREGLEEATRQRELF